MSEKQSIIPIEQREINFQDDKVVAVLARDGTVYVPVKPLCELIGVEWSPQLRRINRDEILGEVVTSVTVTAIDVPEGSDRPKTSHMIALPLDYLNGWLFGISAKRVKEEVRDVLLTYKRECYRVLSEAFSQTGIAARDETLMQSASPQGAAYRTALAVAKLAREQYYMGLRIDDHEKRLGLIEARLSNPSQFVTEDQAQLISQGIKAIATVLGKRSRQNEFGGTYAELYRRYGITSYKRLPVGRFEHAMEWLRSWWVELTSDDDVPF